MNSFYILEIEPMSQVPFANIFSHTVGSLFILIVFFSYAEAFYFDEIPFVYSFLYVPCFKGCVCEDVAACNV